MPELAKNPDMIGVNLSEPISDTVKKTFLQHALGPRGGLFLLGVFTGLFIMHVYICLLYTSPSPRDQRGSRMPSSA